MNAPTAHDLVQRGAALLDEKLPGWADQIDLESLHMADECRCVLGQLGSRKVNLDRLGLVEPHEYWEMRNRLGIQGTEGACGFNVSDSDGSDDYNHVRTERNYPVTYDALRDAWKGEIVARRTLDAR